MEALQFTLYDLITPGGANPAFWACPIQEGIPLILTMIYRLLIFGAGLAFFIGILTAVFYYLTAYGDEAKAKKGKDALKWTFIGSLIVLFSAFLISWVAGSLIDSDETQIVNTVGDNSFVLRGFDTEGNLVQLGKGVDETCNTSGNSPEAEVTVKTGTADLNKQSAPAISDPNKIHNPAATK